MKKTNFLELATEVLTVPEIAESLELTLNNLFD